MSLFEIAAYASWAAWIVYLFYKLCGSCDDRRSLDDSKWLDDYSRGYWDAKRNYEDINQQNYAAKAAYREQVREEFAAHYAAENKKYEDDVEAKLQKIRDKLNEDIKKYDADLEWINKFKADLDKRERELKCSESYLNSMQNAIDSDYNDFEGVKREILKDCTPSCQRAKRKREAEWQS